MAAIAVLEVLLEGLRDAPPRASTIFQEDPSGTAPVRGQVRSWAAQGQAVLMLRGEAGMGFRVMTCYGAHGCGEACWRVLVSV